MSQAQTQRGYVVVTEEASTVVVDLTVGGETYEGVGWAKRHPKDRHDPVVAELVAWERALLDLAEQVGGAKASAIEQNTHPARRARTLAIAARDLIQSLLESEPPPPSYSHWSHR